MTMILRIFTMASVVFLSGPVNALTLPDTGQILCYSQTGAVISCTNTGQDGAFYANQMSYTDHGNGTITDDHTGLMWQKMDDGNSYTWYQASGTYHSTYNPAGQNVCGNLNLAGHSDWRLPSPLELATLIDVSVAPDGPTIRQDVFPDSWNVRVWANRQYVTVPEASWLVYFNDGSVGVTNAEYAGHVRCVRGSLELASAISNGDSTVTDQRTGLIWQQQTAPETKNWQGALDYCNSLTLGEHSDWRLPNIKELISLVDPNYTSPAINSVLFPGTVSSYYWSSTTLAGLANGGWVVRFDYGTSEYGSHYKSYPAYVRCVRGAQEGFPFPGDLNLDSEVDLKDAILGLQVLSGMTPFESISAAAEISVDGRIGLEEVIFIMQQMVP